MAEAAEHGHRGTVERRLEARPVGLVAERRRRPPARVGDAVVGRDDGVAVNGVAGDQALSVPPVARVDLGDDLLADGLDLLVGERPLGRLQRHLDGERLLAGAEHVALEEVEDRHRADQLPIGARRRAHHAGRLDAAVEDEGEVAPDRLQVGERERRLGLGRPRLRSGMRLEDQLEAGERAVGVERRRGRAGGTRRRRR